MSDDEETGLRGYLLTGQREFLQPYRAAQAVLPALSRHIDALSATEPEARALIAAQRRLARDWEGWAAATLRQRTTVLLPSPAAVAQQRTGKRLFDRYRAATQGLLLTLDAERRSDLVVTLDALTRLTQLFSVLFAVAIGLGLLLGWWTIRAVRQPLRLLGRAADAIGRGDLTRPVGVRGAREFVHLAARLDAMRAQINGQRALAVLLGSTLRVEEIYVELAAQARALTPFDRFTLSTVEDDGTAVRVAYSTGWGADAMDGAPRPIDTTAQGRRLSAGECLMRDDLAALPPDAIGGDEQVLQAAGLRSSASVPLMASGHLFGMLTLASAHPGLYTPDTLGPILALAPLITAALYNARTHARAEQYALQAAASEERLHTVIANAPIILFALDVNGVYTLSEGVALGRLDRTRGAVVGQSVFDVYRARPDLAEQARRALAGEEVAFSGRFAQGTFENHLVPLRDAEGRVSGVIGVAHDVTERVAAEEALGAREARYRALTEHGHDLVCILGDDGSVHYESPSWQSLLGEPLAAVYARHGTTLGAIHPDDHAVVRAAFTRVAAPGAPAEMLEWRLRAADGSWRTLECIATNHRDDPAIEGLVITNRDVTARTEAEEVLRLSEQRFRTLVERAPVGACIIDEQGIFETVNDAYAALYGYTADGLRGQSFSLILPSEQQTAAATLQAAYLADPRATESEDEVVGPTGEAATILVTTVPLSGPRGVKRATFAIDITERKRGEQRLTLLAHHDALTGLPNRALFQDRLVQGLAQARRENSGLAVLFLDLDGFKAVNDTLGHEAGDVLLRTIARLLRECTRASDTVARLGGDEFTLILPAIGSRENAARVAHTIITAIGRPLMLEGQAASVTASVGISLYPGDGQDGGDAEDLLKEADQAMYRAKRQGKGVYVFADDAPSTAALVAPGATTPRPVSRS